MTKLKALHISRLAAARVTRVQRAVAHGEPVADPRKDALETEAVATVGEGAVFAEIDEPVVRRRIEALALERGHELVVVVDTHRAANDLADIRQQAVDAQRDSRILRVARHVERLDLDGEVREEDGLVDRVGHVALLGLGNVVTEFERLASVAVHDAVLVQPVQRVNVLHAAERQLRRYKPRVQLLNKLLDLRVGQQIGDRVRNHALDVVEHHVESKEPELGLDVRVLRKMAARLRPLGPEALLDTVAVAERRHYGLEVQLRRLREVRRLAVVVKRKQGRAALDHRLHHARRRDLGELFLREVLAEAGQKVRAHLHHRRQRVAAQGQVPAVHEHRRASILGHLVAEGLVAAGRKTNNVVVVGHELVAAGGRLALGQRLQHTADLDRGLERELRRLVRVGKITLEHALQQTVAVAQHNKHETLLGPQAVDPARDSDTLVAQRRRAVDLGAHELLAVINDLDVLARLLAGPLGLLLRRLVLVGLRLLGGLLLKAVSLLLRLLQEARRDQLVRTSRRFLAGLEDKNLLAAGLPQRERRRREGLLLASLHSSFVLTGLLVHVDLLVDRQLLSSSLHDKYIYESTLPQKTCGPHRQ